MQTRVNAYAVGCGVLATIEQWYPTREFNGTMVPHKRNSKVWPGLVTKEKTMKYPTSAICTVCVYWNGRAQNVWSRCQSISTNEPFLPKPTAGLPTIVR